MVVAPGSEGRGKGCSGVDVGVVVVAGGVTGSGGIGGGEVGGGAGDTNSRKSSTDQPTGALS